ncbi:MAG: hypothetical protein AABZ60_08875 [Planctomycetota bacterium]
MKRMFLNLIVFFACLLSAQETAEKVVHQRILFGFAGQQPVTLSRDGGWIELGKLSEPFQGAAPECKKIMGRKWRIYAVYSAQPSGGPTANIQIKFIPQGMGPNQSTQSTFTLPQKESELDRTIDGYSDFFPSGLVQAPELTVPQVTCMARLNSQASYNQLARLFWVELVAYEGVENGITALPPKEVTLPEKEYHLKGKVLYKPWSKSMESWNAGGSDYCILDTVGFENAENPPLHPIYLRPSNMVSFDVLKGYQNMAVEIVGILDTPKSNNNWENLPEEEKGQYPVEMEFDEHGNMTRKPAKGGPGMGMGISIKSILGLATPLEPAVPILKTIYKLQGRLLVSPPVQGRPYNIQIDLKEFYPEGHAQFSSSAYLLPSKTIPYGALKQHKDKYVEITGMLDPKEMKALIVETLSLIEKPIAKKDKIYVLQGKIVQKFWTKSMESWLAGGSDYCILDTTGFYNKENPVSRAIYLRPSEYLTYNDIRQYDGKIVEIRGVYDVPQLTITPDTMKGQYPVGPDGKPEAPAGSGDGIRVYEIRVNK